MLFTGSSVMTSECRASSAPEANHSAQRVPKLCAIMEGVASLQKLQKHKCPRLHKSTLVNLVLPLPFWRASLWHLNFGKLRQKQLLRVESLAPGIQQVHALLS